jgi:hypothetical protein
MIDISKLKKGSRLIRHWCEGEDKTSDFIVTSVVQDPDKGWIAEVDWSDDDYNTTIYEQDQHKYEYGRRRNDRRPRHWKEIKEELEQE